MLKRLGHNIYLLEQTASCVRPNQAAGMGTGPRGSELLKIHDRCNGRCAFQCPGFQTLNSDGSIKRLMGPSLNLTSLDVLYTRLRANYDGLKSSHYPKSPSESKSDGRTFYNLGKRAVATFYRDGVVTVQYEDVIRGIEGSHNADLVIVVNGSNSMIRRTLYPQLKYVYSRYVAWRGVVPERDISKETKRLFDSRFNTVVMKRAYIAGYAMPGDNSTLIKDQRYFNWIWYYCCPKDSTRFAETMTDTDGHLHKNTLPIGKIHLKYSQN